MSQSQKRPGVRDISELKARLGLKKGGPAAKRGGAGAVPPPGGVVPPPGVPAPPGVQQQRNVSDDPFAAMNEMAQQAVHARSTGPEIVLVDTSGPVESVENKSSGITYAKWAGLVLVPLVVGVIVGQIGTNASRYNETVEDSAWLAEDVKKLRGSLVQIQVAVQNSQSDFKVNDERLLKELEAIEFYRPDVDNVYDKNMYDLENELVAATLEFYTEAIDMQRDVKKFVEQTKRDQKVLAAAGKVKEETTPENDITGIVKYSYAVQLHVPDKDGEAKGEYLGAKMVELGRPICQDGNPSNTGACPGAFPSSYEVRESPDQGFINKPIANAAGLGGDRLVMVIPNATMEGLVKGSEALVAELRYAKDFNDIAERLQVLVDLGNGVEKRLRSRSGSGKKFTFFM